VSHDFWRRKVVPLLAAGCATAAILAACGGDELVSSVVGAQAPTSAWRWDVPRGFPIPKVPLDNPMSEARFDLGRHLFHDVRLSGNRTQACASCHVQEAAFTEPKPRSVGSTGEQHPRSSMALANVAYQPVLTWANPNLRRLEQQALIPMFGEDPVELGMAGREGELLQRVRDEPRYPPLFRAAFPGDSAPITVANIAKALATFQRGLISANSPYDRYRFRGERTAISASAQRGEALFNSEELECFHCHGGPLLTGTSDFVGKGSAEVEFFNNGLYNVGGTGRYPDPNTGLYEFTRRSRDMGLFKAPSLRNIALTAPYMHDGSVATLDEAIDHYAAGGRVIASGPNAGDGRANPNKSGFIAGFTLSTTQRADLKAFLLSLTDSTFITNPRFRDPWRR
jgi:cytochrome c peroxidase